MPRVNGLINTFTGGEISPKARYRSDIEGFRSAAEYQRNWLSDIQGGLRFREGAQLIANTPFNQTPYYMPFVYDSFDSYLIEITATNRSTMRFFDGNTGQIMPFWHPINIERIESRTNQYVVHVNTAPANLTGRTLTVNRITIANAAYQVLNDISIAPAAINVSTFNPAWAEVVYTINGAGTVAAFVPAGAPVLQVFQGNLVIERLEQRTDETVVHVNTPFAPPSSSTIAFSGITDSGYEFLNDIHWGESAFGDPLSFDAQNTSSVNSAWREFVFSTPGSTTVAPFAPAGAPRATVHLGIVPPWTELELTRLQYDQNFDSVFVASGARQVQRIQRLDSKSFTIGNFALTNSSAVAQFNTQGNYPYCLRIYENRLWLSKTDNSPSTIWGSQTNVFDKFNFASTPAVASDPISYTVSFSNDEVVSLQQDKDFLYLQTIGGALIVDGGGSSAPITQSSIRIRPMHKVGSALGAPFFAKDEDIFFVSRDLKTLRKIEFNFNRDKFTPVDISIPVEHFGDSLFLRGTVKAGRDSRIYLSQAGGSLATCLYDSNLGLNSWAKIEPPNGWAFGDVCAIPRSEKDDLVFVSLRDGSTDKIYTCSFESKGDDTLELELENVEMFSGTRANDSKRLQRFEWLTTRQQVYLDLWRIAQDTRPSLSNLVLGATTGNTTATSAVPLFTANDVGKKIYGRLSNLIGATTPSPDGGVAEITAYSSSTSVDITVLENFPSTTLSQGGWYISYLLNQVITVPMHYAGKTVTVLVDGSEHTATITSAGALTIPRDGLFLTIGYKYRGLYKSTNLQGGSRIGPSDTHLKNIHELGLAFYKSTDVKFGTDLYDLESLSMIQGDDPIDEPTPLFTGEKIVNVRENWTGPKHVYIVKDSPGRCFVQAIVPYMNVSDD